MTVACGQCGTESPRTAKFCSECGAKLHPPSVEPERADADLMAEADVPLPAHDASDASRRPPRPAAPVSIEHGAKSRKIVLVKFTAVQPSGLHRPIPRRAAPPAPAPPAPAPLVLPPPRSHSPPPVPLGPIPAYARDLNPQQQQAVLAPTNEPLLVLAAAGSGKTSVIVRRVQHILAGGARPSSVLAITFTKAAAEEMQQRLGVALGRAAGKVTVSTFHALSLQICREHADLVGYGKDFVVRTPKQQRKIVQEALREMRNRQAASGAGAGAGGDGAGGGAAGGAAGGGA